MRGAAPPLLLGLVLALPLAATSPAMPAAMAAAPELPLPPVPPAHPPVTHPAPVPDLGIEAPAPPARDGVSVSPELFSRYQRYFRGDGFPQGTTNEAIDARRYLLVPGLKLSVPLQ
jgi:hypothetical protein